MFSFFKKFNKTESEKNKTEPQNNTENKVQQISKQQPVAPVSEKPVPKAVKKTSTESADQKMKLQDELKKCIADFTKG